MREEVKRFTSFMGIICLPFPSLAQVFPANLRLMQRFKYNFDQIIEGHEREVLPLIRPLFLQNAELATAHLLFGPWER